MGSRSSLFCLSVSRIWLSSSLRIGNSFAYRHTSVLAFVLQHSSPKVPLSGMPSPQLSSPSSCPLQPATKRHCSSHSNSEISMYPNRYICCPKCQGEGQVRSRRRRTKKQKRELKHAKDNGLPLPKPPPPVYEPCKECSGTGLLSDSHDLFSSEESVNLLPRVEDETHVGICGGGIGGLALALACQHRNIPYTVYERDQSFDERKQGYGLTMQQGGKALQALGLETTGEDRLFGKGIHSKRHIVHLPDGKTIGEWG